MIYTGVDGCKVGWFSVVIDDNSAWETSISNDVSEVWKKQKQSRVILIDIPIGLNGKNHSRLCDAEARKLLKGRTSSVFNAPCRKALKAKTHEEASGANKSITGKGLSKQAFNIMKKIREVDDFIAKTDKARNKLRESHPELCFYHMAGRVMECNKKSTTGYEERIRVLSGYFPDAEKIVQDSMDQFRRNQVARDDIVDALAMAIMAFSSKGELISLLNPVPKDEKGLPMTMWLWKR